MKNLKHGIDSALFHLISVTLAARLKVILDDAQTLPDDAFPFRELRQLRPERDFRRKFGNCLNCGGHRNERQATNSGYCSCRNERRSNRAGPICCRGNRLFTHRHRVLKLGVRGIEPSHRYNSTRPSVASNQARSNATQGELTGEKPSSWRGIMFCRHQR